MRKRKKITKLWIVLTLVVSLFAVQTLQIMAEASTETADFSNPTIVVNDITELQNAVANANDGDVIGINSLITITTDIGQLGSVESGKHLYLVRMNEDARFKIMKDGSVSFCNMTIDGQKSDITGTVSMFYVIGSLSLNQVTVQNCSTQGSGAVAWVEPSGILNATNAVFSDNTAQQAGHIYASGTVNLNNCTMKNGIAARDGGAIAAFAPGVTTMTNCKIYGNSATIYGGGIRNNGSVTLSGCAVFGNTADAGSDIANSVAVQSFQMDSLTDSLTVYEGLGITPVEWVLDYENLSSDWESYYDISNPCSLMKLVYQENIPDDGNEDTEDSGNTEDGDNTESGDNTENGDNAENGDDTEDGDNTENGDDTENGDNAENGDNTENEGSGGNDVETGDGNNPPEDSGAGEDAGDSGVNEGENTDNDENAGDGSSTGDNSDNSVDGNQTPESGSSDNTDSDTSDDGIDSDSSDNEGKDMPNYTITNQEDYSQTNSTTETHEDKSTTTNNYYTYNTPATNAPATNLSNQQNEDIAQKETGTDTSTKPDNTEAGNVEANSTPSANAQIPDNIKLDLYNVNIVYEMESGVSNIAISNEPEKIAETVVEPVVLENATEMVNWYEIIKMILLAAIFIVVVPKPVLKKEK